LKIALQYCVITVVLVLTYGIQQRSMKMTRSELLRVLSRLTHDTGVEYWKVNEDIWDDNEMTITFTNLSQESTEEVTSVVGG